jgi:hypothetical protein
MGKVDQTFFYLGRAEISLVCRCTWMILSLLAHLSLLLQGLRMI